MPSRRSVIRYWLSAGVVTLGGCVVDSSESETRTTRTAETSDPSPTASEAESAPAETTSIEASSAGTSQCSTQTTVRGGTDLFVANRTSTEKRLSASVFRVADGERERRFSETYPLSSEERALSEDVITDTGRYRVEASTEDGASASFETPLPDENDEPLDHYSVDVIVTESENVEIGLSIADVGTPTAFGDGC